MIGNVLGTTPLYVLAMEAEPTLITNNTTKYKACVKDIFYVIG